MLMGLADAPWQAFTLCTSDGLALAAWGVLATSVRQRLTPADLRSRATAVYRIAGQGAMLIGTVVGGYLAFAVSLRAPLLLAGFVAGAVVVTLAGKLTMPAKTAEEDAR